MTEAYTDAVKKRLKVLFFLKDKQPQTTPKHILVGLLIGHRSMLYPVVAMIIDRWPMFYQLVGLILGQWPMITPLA